MLASIYRIVILEKDVDRGDVPLMGTSPVRGINEHAGPQNTWCWDSERTEVKAKSVAKCI